MSEQKHTPGPWVIGNYDWSIETETDIEIAQMAIDQLSKDEWKANAHLIAAAPEMLEALTMAVDALSVATTHQAKDREIVRRAQNKVYAAIAKAKGE